MPDNPNRNDPVRYSILPGVRLSETINRISWGAVWAGVMIALGMEALFALFGFFVGFGMYNSQAANPWAGISAWTTIWYLVTAGWSMFFGAWCAARLSGNPVREAGVLQGITTWGLASSATIALVAFGAWAIFREGINAQTVAALAPASLAGSVSQATQQAGQALSQQNPGATAQATASILSGLALKIWGGVLLGFITSIIGGLVGRSKATIIVDQQLPGPTRMAA